MAEGHYQEVAVLIKLCYLVAILLDEGLMQSMKKEYKLKDQKTSTVYYIVHRPYLTS